MPTSLYHPRYDLLRAALVAARKGAGLTQVEMAARLGVGQSYVSKMERGDSYVELFAFMDWCKACNQAPGKVLDELAERMA